ncbi:hypothetical protein HPB50_018896 [Hyalomma asiaticum]|uniref:Uncharacterized protein n=1 Tax=Hyalomma asiaticum TaxID=266040 RepID=A0ACB7RK02_HYAAI|nr:hypothetical protein HPB50_018896 [Hyalomma asiaticum]
MSLPEAKAFAKMAEEATTTESRRPTFRGFREEQLFFLVSCFMECGIAYDPGPSFAESNLQRGLAYSSGVQACLQVQAAPPTDEQLHVARANVDDPPCSNVVQQFPTAPS